MPPEVSPGSFIFNFYLFIYLFIFFWEGGVILKMYVSTICVKKIRNLFLKVVLSQANIRNMFFDQRTPGHQEVGILKWHRHTNTHMDIATLWLISVKTDNSYKFWICLHWCTLGAEDSLSAIGHAPATWHVTGGGEMNLLLMFQVPSSYGLALKVFWRFWGKRSLACCINQSRRCF